MLAPDPDHKSTPYTRLHITPLDHSLLSLVVPSSVLPRARNISFHSLQTFPDKPYGFLDLPIDDAERLKKKLNGAVLKGSKVSIQPARQPTPFPAPASTSSSRPDGPSKHKIVRKRKKEQGVIPGAEIKGRKIKRGWTTSEAEMIQKKRQKAGRSKHDNNDDDNNNKKPKRTEVKKSKYTDAPECLFKTRLASKSNPVSAQEPKLDDGDLSTPPRKKKRRFERDTVIHEFEKTNKFPSFLKANSDKAAADATTFVDGKGWVDSSGNVVEASKSTRPPTAGIVRAKVTRSKNKRPAVAAELEDDPNVSSSSDGSSSEDEDEGRNRVSTNENVQKGQNSDADTTSSEEDDEFSSDGEGSYEEGSVAEPDEASAKLEASAATVPPDMSGEPHSSLSAVKADASRPKSSGSVTSLTIKIPPATPGPVKVHPLEALYKRLQGSSATPGAQESKPFSFFDTGDDIVEEDTTTTQTLQVPMTPFTERDFEFRNMRSAAPTPDTAHPSRTFAPWSTQATLDEEDEEDEMNDKDAADASPSRHDSAMLDVDDMLPTAAAASTSSAPVSDFQKHFWGNRGDLNRKWRKRRKTAAKEKRYRDNRARADRAI